MQPSAKTGWIKEMKTKIENKKAIDFFILKEQLLLYK